MNTYAMLALLLGGCGWMSASTDSSGLPGEFASAWPVDSEHSWVPRGGRMLRTDGATDVPEGQPCGNGMVVKQSNGVLALPQGDAFVFPRSPAVQAAVVERAAWRLAEALGDAPRLYVGGGNDKDPATYRGVQVRSVKKTRRSGPPVMIAVGDRDGEAAIAVVDADARRVFATAKIPGRLDEGVVPLALPVWDYDHDGQRELVIYGNGRTETGESTGFRAVYRVVLGRTTHLELMGMERGPAPQCSADQAVRG